MFLTPHFFLDIVLAEAAKSKPMEVKNMKIKYKLANGKTVEVEVTEEQTEVIVKTVRKAENNETKHRLRKAKEASLDYLSDEYDWEPQDSSPTPDEILEEREEQEELAEQKERLKEVVALLTPKQQEIIRLHFYENKTFKQIAVIFGTDPKNIHGQLEVIKKKIKKLF